MFLIMAIFSVNVFAGVITEKELNSDESFEYIYRVNKHDIFKCKNGDCDLIYNNSNNYCQNLSSLQDELEADIRARWICPKVYAFSELYKKYKIRLGDNPVFSDYILNLYRIMENSNYSILENNIRIDSKRIFIVKKITKKYIESLNLVLTMNMNKKSDEIDDSFIKNFIYDENDIDNTISFLNEVRSILNKILFEIEHIKKL